MGLTVDAHTYAQMCVWTPTNSVDAAARLLYLNRTGYGGIYRENARGDYNVPFSGDRGIATILDDDRLEATGRALLNATIVDGDFEDTLTHARAGTLVYCDPPYSLPGREKAFRRYGATTFTWSDQIRLAAAVNRLASAGATVVVSNLECEEVRDLYPSAETVAVSRQTTLARGPAKRLAEALFVVGDGTKRANSVAHLLHTRLQ